MEFFPGGAVVDFSRGIQIEFSRRGKSGETSFHPFETNKTTFLCSKFIKKLSNYKIQGAIDPLAPHSDAHVHYVVFCDFVCSREL